MTHFSIPLRSDTDLNTQTYTPTVIQTVEHIEQLYQWTGRNICLKTTSVTRNGVELTCKKRKGERERDDIWRHFALSSSSLSPLTPFHSMLPPYFFLVHFLSHPSIPTHYYYSSLLSYTFPFYGLIWEKCVYIYLTLKIVGKFSIDFPSSFETSNQSPLALFSFSYIVSLSWLWGERERDDFGWRKEHFVGTFIASFMFLRTIFLLCTILFSILFSSLIFHPFISSTEYIGTLLSRVHQFISLCPSSILILLLFS